MPERQHRLDSLRGLAALMVVLCHLVALAPPLPDWFGWLMQFSPLRAVVGGRAPVLFFFVLSGHVLTLALLRPRAPGPFSFALRRSVRLLLPVVAVVVLSAVLRELTWKGPVNEGGWLLQGSLWSEDPTLRRLLTQMLLLGGQSDFSLNLALWSLVHEWRISLVMPAVLLFRSRPVLLLALGSLALTVSVAGGAPLNEAWLGRSLLSTLPATLYFVLPFTVGAALALAPASMAWQLQGEVRLAAWIAVAVAASLPSDLAVIIGSALLILIVREPGAVAAVLDTRPLQWLGRVSFSLYLVHLPVLAAVVHGSSGLLSLPVALLLGALLCLPAAELFYVLVERRALVLSRNIGMPWHRRPRLPQFPGPVAS